MRSPAFKSLRCAADAGSLKSIVIAPHLIDGIGPCESVNASRPRASIRASPWWRGAPVAAGADAAVAAVVAAVAAPAGFGASFNRASTPLRLASESIRNCDDTTTRCPACRPLLISVWPALSMPACTSTGLNPPLASASITTVRRPVWITASVGISRALSARVSVNCIETNIPGTSWPRALASSTRAFNVRVAGLTSGTRASTRPSNQTPGAAAVCARTFVPGRSSAAWLSGTSALAHTVAKPLILNNVAPGITVMPSRTASSVTRPDVGERIAMRGSACPLASTRRIWSSLMPACRIRARAPSTSTARSGPCIRRTPRNSSCAATQSGTYSSASTWPLVTRSSVARTRKRSTYPVARACTMAWSRSLKAMLPTAASCGDRVPSVTTAVRRPRFCWMRELTVILP